MNGRIEKIAIKAFTLIELLIVVAVIAILAAIAVPSFLEAQTRATVTRVMSDMRATAVAMEAYFVDNNDYPNCRWPDPDPLGREDPLDCRRFFFVEYYPGTASATDPFSAGFGFMLTTPISYITSIPWDPSWATYLKQFIPDLRTATTLATMLTGGGFGYTRHPIPFDAYRYFLTSPGPNSIIYAHDRSTIYDPTNGTVSNGDIHYLHPNLHPIGFIGGPGNAYAGFDLHL